ncbi:unnamed protein product [Ectocarpus sp. 6 AP-2014]
MFDFRGGDYRGGTAPPTFKYPEHSLSDGIPPAADPHRYCEQDGGAAALPTAPVFRGQRGKGGGSTATYKHSHPHSRSGWGKRGPKGRRPYDPMGPKTRPASRQVLSDLMDLNLALKFAKMGKQDSTSQPDEQPQQSAGLKTRTGRRHDGGGARAAEAESSSTLFSDRQASQASRYSSPSERYKRVARARNSAVLGASNNEQLDHEDVSTSVKHPAVEKYTRWDDDMQSTTPCVPATTTCDVPLMISPSRNSTAHTRSSSQGDQGDEQFNTAPQARDDSRSSAWRSENTNTYRGPEGGNTPQGFGQGSRSEVDIGVWTEYAEDREQGQHTPSQDTCSQQSEKDQRMWSALKNSLLSGSPRDMEGSRFEFQNGRIDDGGNLDGGTDPRDLEQLDLERSAMDRTMRPHRVASARLLEKTQNSSVQAKVKQLRTFSASATRPRTRQGESASSVWAGAGGILQCTGVRAELVSRNSDWQSSYNREAASGHSTFDGEAVNRRRESVHQQARKKELGCSRWVTNDEGVANFLQRPPSRQKEAFPTHLADVVPYAAFQVEVPMTDEEAKQLIEATRKTAVEQTRPPSRHKPPEQSLFLEVPETRRQIPPALSPSRRMLPHGAESCSALSPGVFSIDVPEAEASPSARDALGTIFALDRRHDNPDRDGFSVLQVQGPCPFRIEVTNSFVQAQPPKAPVDRETVVAPDARKAAKYRPPDPSCGLFGPMACDSGENASAGKQRAPINTTPNRAGPAIGSPVPARSHTAGKNCGMSFRLLGSRSTGGITSTTAPCSIRGRDNSSAGAIPLPPPRTGNVNHEPTDEGRPGTSEVGEFSGLVDGAVENSAGRRANAAAGGNSPSAGRRDSSGLVVSTAASGQNVADWSLQSCDDADDGAFLDQVPTSGEADGTHPSRLETTLGQDFLRLFAPSSGHNNGSGLGELHS